VTIFLYALSLITAFAAPSGALTVLAKDGNIVLESDSGRKTLTTSGRDSSPCLSRDRRWVVFVRETPDRILEMDWGRTEAREIWVIRSDGRHPRRIVEGGRPSGVRKGTLFSELASPQFLSDSRRVAFLSRCVEVHGSVHIVDIATGKIRFIAAGSSLDVVRSGEYRDCLIVNLHKYFVQGGSYDWYWLLRANGKEIGPIGEGEQDLSSFRDFYESEMPARQP